MNDNLKPGKKFKFVSGDNELQKLVDCRVIGTIKSVRRGQPASVKPALGGIERVVFEHLIDGRRMKRSCTLDYYKEHAMESF